MSTRHEYPIAAIAHNTPRYPLGPTALPGTYTVRLSVDGKTSTASLTVKMDPRVKAPAADLQKKFESEKKLASIMSDIAQASLQAGSLRAQVEKINPETASQPKDAILSLPEKTGCRSRRRWRILCATIRGGNAGPREWGRGNALPAGVAGERCAYVGPGDGD